jgi:hypothetical protein
VKSGLSWAFTTWLALIALQAVATRGGSGRIAQAFTDVDQLLTRALDPNVPAIPDRRTATAASTIAASPTAGQVPAASAQFLSRFPALQTQ